MKKSTLLCILAISASQSTQITPSYTQRTSQGAFRNHHRHPQHNASAYFTTIKEAQKLEEARNAQNSPATKTSSPTPQRFIPGLSPQKAAVSKPLA